MIRARRKWLVVASFLLALIAGPVLASNGGKLTSYGARAAGRGGVDYAFADDATAPATNPAGIAFTPNRLDNVWLAALPTAEFRNQLGIFNMTPGWTVPVPAYSFGVVFDPTQSWHVGDLFDLGNWGLKPQKASDSPEDRFELAQANDEKPRGRKDDALPPPPGPTVPVDAVERTESDEEMYGGRLHFGFGIFPVSGGAFRYRHIITPFWSPAAVEYRTEASELAIAPTVAFRIVATKDFSLSLGYSPQFHYATFKLNGPIEQPNTTLNPTFRFASNLLGSRSVISYATSHDLSTFGFSQRLGLMARIGEMLNIGLVYQDRTYLQDYLGSSDVDANQNVARLTANAGGPAALQALDPRINPSAGFNSTYGMRIQNLQQPRMFGVGIAVRPLPRVALGFDYTFINWEELYRVLAVRLTGGSNPNLDVLTSPTVKVRVPLEYRNQHVIAVGASVVALQGDDIVPGVPSFQLILRAGYNWAQEPVPASTAIPQTPIFYEHHLSGGFTFQWGPYLDFTAAIEYAFQSSIHTGTSQVNSDLSFSHQTSSLLTLIVGLGVNF